MITKRNKHIGTDALMIISPIQPEVGFESECIAFYYTIEEFRHGFWMSAMCHYLRHKRNNIQCYENVRLHATTS